MLEDIIFVVSSILQYALTAIQLAMFLRMIFSWFPMEPNNFTELLYTITEPIVYPFRALFARLNLFQNLPIDVAFTAAWFFLMILNFLVAFI